MALKQNKQLKLYYSIKEVAEMFRSERVVGALLGKRNFPPSLRNGWRESPAIYERRYRKYPAGVLSGKGEGHDTGWSQTADEAKPGRRTQYD